MSQSINQLIIQKMKEIEMALKAGKDIVIKYDQKNDIIKVFSNKVERL